MNVLSYFSRRIGAARATTEEAVANLIKSADTPVPTCNLEGTLYASSTGWIMLTVPNALVRGVFEAMHEPGAELPTSGEDGRLNAHCSVMRPEEVETLGGVDAISERGKSFKYTLGAIKSVRPKSWDGISRVWYITVSSPELQKLRRSYGLSSLPNNGKHEFHITVAARKSLVLGSNPVAKG